MIDVTIERGRPNLVIAPQDLAISPFAARNARVMLMLVFEWMTEGGIRRV